jgi:subtilase family serine protease
MYRLRLLAAFTAMSTASVTWAASTTLNGHVPKFTATHIDLGPEAGSKPLHLRIWLNGHQTDQLKRIAEEVRDPSSSRYRKFLSKSETDSFKATPAEVSRVVAYMQSRGLKNVKADSNRLYVEATGTADQARQLFQVDLRRFLVNGQVVTANNKNPQVDNEIAGLVSYVGGLSTHTKRPMIRHTVDPSSGTPIESVPFKVGPTATLHNTVCFGTTANQTFKGADGAKTESSFSGNRFGDAITSTAPALPPCGYGPKEIQAAYGIDKLIAKGLDGRGQTIVIVDAFGSPTIEGDAKDFSDSYGLEKLDLTVYQPAGTPPVTGTWNDGQQGWAGETTLDVEWAHVMAPGAKIALVEANSDADSDLNAAIAFAVENNLGNQISNSWSGNESDEDDASLALAEAILETAVARGVSVHFSSGDDGDLVKQIGYSDVGYPSSSKYVTSIGGTSLALKADHSILFQTGWGNNAIRVADGVATVEASAAGQNAPLSPPDNVGFAGGAGGGTSRIFPKPSFQKNIAGTGRMQPDISYLADPFTGVELVESGFDKAGNPQGGNLALSTIGGTSLACPMFTAVWAIANQAHGRSLGQAAPLLYKLPKSAIVDILPVSSPDNVTGEVTDDKGVSTPLTQLNLGQPETAAGFYSALYNSPNSPYRWLVISFGTDSSLPLGQGWDAVTGLGVPNGEKFIDALR